MIYITCKSNVFCSGLLQDKQVTQVPADARGLAVTRELQDSLDYQASQGLEVLAQVMRCSSQSVIE